MENKSKTLYTFLAVEHARFHIVDAWPESSQKLVLLAAIQQSLRRLTADPQAASFSCLLCPSSRSVAIIHSSRQHRSIENTRCKAA
jgi:hypothetical protein